MEREEIDEDPDYFTAEMLNYALQMGMQENLDMYRIFANTCKEVWEDKEQRHKLPVDLGERFVTIFAVMLESHGREIPVMELRILKFIQGLKSREKAQIEADLSTVDDRIKLRGKEEFKWMRPT